jgi:hypothetical protein
MLYLREEKGVRLGNITRSNALSEIWGTVDRNVISFRF